MKQNRFFSAVYIIGTGLAISMVMTMAVVWHIRMSDVAPEVSRSRSYFTSNATYKSKEQGYSSMSMLGYRLVRELLPELKVPERCCVSISPNSMGYLLGGVFLQTPGGEETLETELRPCDAAFWQVFRLRFMAGAPFTEEEVASGVKRIVLAESLARRLFGSVDVTGREVLMNYIPYTVAGVVEDVSLTATDAYAEAWVPYSSVEQLVETDEQGGSVGGFNPVFVLKKNSDLAALQAELDEAVKRYNTTLTEGTLSIKPLQSYTERELVRLFRMEAGKTWGILLGVLLLFLLVPALSLSGLNASHIQERMDEFGVRKAFGAPRSSLFGQVFWENMLLMLPGGVAGLLFSYVIVAAYSTVLFSARYTSIDDGSVLLSAGMLLNGQVFLAAFMACLVLNLLSSMVPAWRAVRVNIVDALNSKTV